MIRSQEAVVLSSWRDKFTAERQKRKHLIEAQCRREREKLDADRWRAQEALGAALAKKRFEE